jgi:predicted regulator of Ras-like GTPase activity (Roadblock/LC7/MglB family)
MGLFGFGSENENNEEKKETDSSQESLTEKNEKPSPSGSMPRLKSLPSGLKKVSAGSISLSAHEVASHSSQISPPSANPAQSEEIAAESQRILASLASFAESETSAEVVEEKPKLEEEKSTAQTFISPQTPTIISESFSSVSHETIPVEARRQRAYKALSRWVGEPAAQEISLVSLPKILLSNNEIQAATIIDQEGLILGLETALEINRKVMANLMLRLFSQCQFAAEELDLTFRNQTVVHLGELTVQISFCQGFYLITFHRSLPSIKLLHRLRKIVRALARVEMGS